MRIVNPVWRLLAVLAVISVVVGCGGPATPIAGEPSYTGQQARALCDGGAEGFSTEPIANPDGLPEPFVYVGSTAELALYIRPSRGHIIVADRRNGHLWASNPFDLRPEIADDLNDVQRRLLSAPFVVSTTTADLQSVTLVVPTYEDSAASSTAAQTRATTTAEARPNGVRFHHRLNSSEIEFALDICLVGPAMEMHIAPGDVSDDSRTPLVSIAPLPNFGSVLDDTTGYLLLPDGPGALVRFRSDHPSYVQSFNEEIYGPSTYSFVPRPTLPVRLTVFGIYHESPEPAAVLGIVTRGDHHARLVGAPAGFQTPFYRAFSDFIVRRQISLQREAGTATRADDTAIETERATRYVFLAGDDAGYVGMARAYRDYLVAEHGLPPRTDAEPSLNLGLLMGVSQKVFFFEQLTPLTTFDEARQIVEALRARGIEHVRLTLDGWNAGGYRARYPSHLPPESGLGGASGLTALAAFGQGVGVPVGLADDYLAAFADGPGFSANDVLREPNLLPTFDEEREYVLNLRVGQGRLLGDLGELRGLGVAGLTLQRLGGVDLIDANERAPIDRLRGAGTAIDMADAARRELGYVAVDEANAYMLPHVDALTQLPLGGSRYVFVDQDVPFLPIVLHGSVTYTSRPANLAADRQQAFLRSLEYGALPSFILTFRDTEDLRQTPANWLYTARYDLWMEELARQYDVMVRQLGHTLSQPIADHRVLTPGVAETAYADGTRVLVNYTESEYRGEGGEVVPGRGYLIVAPTP